MIHKVMALVRDISTMLMLRLAVNRSRRGMYDSLAQELTEARAVLASQLRIQDDLVNRLRERDSEIQRLRDEYELLSARFTNSEAEASHAERLRLFREMQNVLSQLPSIDHALKHGARLNARDVLDMVAPILTLFIEEGFQPIGAAGQQVSFDPRLHRLAGGEPVSAGADVCIQYIGFTFEGDVLLKAEVIPAEA